MGCVGRKRSVGAGSKKRPVGSLQERAGKWAARPDFLASCSLLRSARVFNRSLSLRVMGIGDPYAQRTQIFPLQPVSFRRPVSDGRSRPQLRYKSRGTVALGGRRITRDSGRIVDRERTSARVRRWTRLFLSLRATGEA